jgi:hypothetical protein
MPFGKKTVTAAGTPQLLFTTAEVPVGAQNVWPVRVSRIRLEALNTNTGLIYIGVKGMVVATLVNVLATIAAPGSNPIVNALEFDQIAFGSNIYRLQDYWIDAAVTGEGVLRTVWIA